MTQQSICIGFADPDGTLTVLAKSLKASGFSVITCVQDGCHFHEADEYDFVLNEDNQRIILEKILCKMNAVLQVGIEMALPAHVPATCKHFVLLEGAVTKAIREELGNEATTLLAKLRIAERFADAVLCRPGARGFCLRPVIEVTGTGETGLAEVIQSLLGGVDCSVQSNLSPIYAKPSRVVLPKALLALSTEVLAMRDDAEELFKELRNFKHVCSTALSPAQLPLPGGKHLAHFMRETAFCPPAIWERASPPARQLIKETISYLVLENQAVALEFASRYMHNYSELLYMGLQLALGGGAFTLVDTLLEALKGANIQPLPAVTQFLLAMNEFHQKRTQEALQKAVASVSALPRLGDQLVWGCSPLLSNKYWSQAMNEGGAASCTLMYSYFGSINNFADFDLYFSDICPSWASAVPESQNIFALLYVALNASVIHIPYSGGPLAQSSIASYEPAFFAACGVKTLVLSYGSDAYLYSQVKSLSLAHALNADYPNAGRNEDIVRENVYRWSKHGDFVMGQFMHAHGGFPRWDMLLMTSVHIDVTQWRPKRKYSQADGINQTVRIVHTPNHRLCKGTEFILDAVKRMQDEGLLIDLVLLEKVQNSVVRQTMQEVDILVEQCLMGYGLSGIEGMASGLPICTNLDEPDLTAIRRYSYLGECPAVSVTPETVYEQLRGLVRNPELRRRLGEAGRRYVEKYHSLKEAYRLYSTIHETMLNNSDTNLHHFYHPLFSEYVQSNPIERILTANNHLRLEDMMDD